MTMMDMDMDMDLDLLLQKKKEEEEEEEENRKIQMPLNIMTNQKPQQRPPLTSIRDRLRNNEEHRAQMEQILKNNGVFQAQADVETQFQNNLRMQDALHNANTKENRLKMAISNIGGLNQDDYKREYALPKDYEELLAKRNQWRHTIDSMF